VVQLGQNATRRVGQAPAAMRASTEAHEQGSHGRRAPKAVCGCGSEPVRWPASSVGAEGNHINASPVPTNLEISGFFPT